jgi:S1-C subfamily serine protease
LFGVLCGVGLVANTGFADDVTRKDVYQHTLKATAWVIAGDGAGTAWVVDANKKLLITNNHVTGKNETVRVIFPSFDKGRVIAERNHYLKNANTLALRGKVLQTDAKRDLALIEVDSLPEGVIELKFAEDGAGPSDNVHSVGNPGISEALWVYTSGTVRQVYRRKVKIDGNEIDARVIETQAPLNPGDSGGPVVNDKGELIGVTAAINRSAQLLSICIDASEVKDFLSIAKVSVAVPKTAEEFLTRARAFFKQRQLDKAIADCTEAIKLEPENFLGYRQRGVILNQKGDYKKAVEDLSTAIDKNPKDPFAYLFRGKSFEKLGEKEKAKVDLEQATKLDPNIVK